MKQKNKRTKRTAIVSVGMAGVLAVGGLFAFMSDHDNVINKFNFTDGDGNQSIDIQLSETLWSEANGKNILYGTPVAKNPVATNIGDNSMYAFATVIVPAKAVTVQNKDGKLVSVNDTTYSSLADAGLTTKIVNNVSAGDKVVENDETEILGVYKDENLAEEYAVNEELPDNGTTYIYFKLNADAPLGVGYTENGTAAGDGDTVAYRVLADTIDTENHTSDILGHQFALKLVEDPNSDVKINVRDLYTFEVADADDKDEDGNTTEADRVIEGKWTNHSNEAGEVDGSSDALNVYSRGATHAYDGENEGWVEITDQVSNKTVYIDSNGKIYSAHVFYYSVPLVSSQSTLPVFDYVELLNVTDAQVDETDDMDIYVETYGVQVTGLDDSINANVDAQKYKEAVEDAEEALTNAQNSLAEKQTAYDNATIAYENAASEDKSDAMLAQNSAKLELDMAKSLVPIKEEDLRVAKLAYKIAEGNVTWNVMTNSEDEFGFDIFGVVKDTNDNAKSNPPS